MGSWNATCGFSGLPISYGTEMYVFIIVESQSDSRCYTNALWKPCIIPFVADYDDYGGGENARGVALERLMEGVKNRLIEFDVGENRFHDIPVKKDGFDVNSFFETSEKQRLKFKGVNIPSFPDMGVEGGYTGDREVSFTLVRKDVVDALKSQWGKYALYENMLDEFIDVCVKSFGENCKPYADKLIDNDTADEEIFGVIQEILMPKFFDVDHPLSSLFKHVFNSGYADGGFEHIYHFKSELMTNMINNRDDAIEMMKAVLVGYFINDYMNCIRKVWMPSMGAGQSFCHKEYRLMSKVMNEIMDKEDVGDE